MNRKEVTERIRSISKNVEWLTSCNDPIMPNCAISLENMTAEHIKNTIRFLENRVYGDDVVLKRQGVYTKREWVCMMQLELLSRSDKKSQYLSEDTLEILSSLFRIKIEEPLKIIEAVVSKEDKESPKDNVLTMNNPDKHLTKFEVDARNSLTAYSRTKGSKPIKSYQLTSLYTIRKTLQLKGAKDEILHQPFTEDEWLTVIELEIAYKSKHISDRYKMSYRNKVPDIMNRFTGKNSTKHTNIVEIRPKSSNPTNSTPSVSQSSPNCCLYKLRIDEAGNVVTYFGEINRSGIVFSLNNYTLFSEEEASVLAAMLNKYNKDQTVEYKYSAKNFIVSKKEEALVYKDGIGAAMYFTREFDNATLFSTKEEAEELVEKALLVFDSLSKKDIFIKPYFPLGREITEITEIKKLPALPPSQQYSQQA